MDVKGADADKVKTQMQERSIPSEDWGGDVVTVPISALKGENVEELLDMILLQAELMELKANPEAVAEGIVVEARMEVGRGPTATVIVQKGTLKVGDAIHCGSVFCVKAISMTRVIKSNPLTKYTGQFARMVRRLPMPERFSTIKKRARSQKVGGRFRAPIKKFHRTAEPRTGK